jgi:hypothetical protein
VLAARGDLTRHSSDEGVDLYQLAAPPVG